MTVEQFLSENYVMFFELIGVLVILNVSAHIPDPMKRKTRLVVLFLFIETLLFYLEKWTQTFERLSVLRPMLTAAVYSLYPVILILLMQVTSKKDLSKRSIFLMLIPEIVSVPVFFTSQWTRLVFWFRDENRYEGGLFSYWPYFLFGFPPFFS